MKKIERAFNLPISVLFFIVFIFDNLSIEGILLMCLKNECIDV